MKKRFLPISRKSGFTLIELLSTVAIIAVLAALLMPAVNSFTKKSRQTQSLANMKSITTALVAFAAENEMRMPSDDGSPRPPTWDVQLLPYLGYTFSSSFDHSRKNITPADGAPVSLLSTYLCPLDKRKAAEGFYPRSYGVSGVTVAPTTSWLGGISGRKAGEGIRLSQIQNLSKFVLLCRTPLDWEVDTNVVGQGGMLATNGPNPNSPQAADWKIFDGKTPFGFADGHVALLTPAATKEVDPRNWTSGM